MSHRAQHALLFARRVQVIRKSEFVLWSHLGLGDTISIYPAVEALSNMGKKVHLPTRSSYLAQVSELFGGLEHVHIFEIPDDPTLEFSSVKAFSSSNRIPIFYAGHYLWVLLSSLRTGMGLNGLLNLMAGFKGPLVSKSLKARLIDGEASQRRAPLPSKYIFVDHHPGTQRELPSAVLGELEDRYPLVTNDLSWSLRELAIVMDQAEELHLVSSAPLCLALTADLALGRTRVRYRVGDAYPLCRDYPLDWEEVSLRDGGATLVSREVEAESSRLGRIAARVCNFLP